MKHDIGIIISVKYPAGVFYDKEQWKIHYVEYGNYFIECVEKNSPSYGCRGSTSYGTLINHFDRKDIPKMIPKRIFGGNICFLK